MNLIRFYGYKLLKTNNYTKKIRIINNIKENDDCSHVITEKT